MSAFRLARLGVLTTAIFASLTGVASAIPYVKPGPVTGYAKVTQTLPAVTSKSAGSVQVRTSTPDFLMWAGTVTLKVTTLGITTWSKTFTPYSVLFASTPPVKLPHPYLWLPQKLTTSVVFVQESGGAGNAPYPQPAPESATYNWQALR